MLTDDRNSKRMPDDVAAVMEKIAMDQGGCNQEEAKQWFKLLVKQRRYQQETWS
jgi:sulfite reductase alpha subunit-like flavoprotein